MNHSRHRQGRLASLFIFIILLSSSAFALKADHIALDELDRYYLQDGLYQTYCSNTIIATESDCRMILNVTKQAETTNATIAFSAHEQNISDANHWYYVPFDRHISDFNIYEENSLANGTKVWSSITSEESKTGILNQSDGVTVRRYYEWTQNHTALDLIPQYYVNETESFIYDEYAVFLDFDGSDLLLYLAWDVSTGLLTGDSVPLTAGDLQYNLHSSTNANNTYQHIGGIDVNGSTHYLNISENSTRLTINQSVDPSAFFVNDDFSYTFFFKPSFWEADINTFIRMVDNNAQFTFRVNANRSVRIYFEDTSANFAERYVGYAPEMLPLDVWTHIGVTGAKTGGTIDMNFYVNGIINYAENLTGLPSPIFTGMNDCSVGDGGCYIMSSTPVFPTILLPPKGGADEIRLYNKVITPEQMFLLADFDTLANNVTIPVIQEETSDVQASAAQINGLLTGAGEGIGSLLDTTGLAIADFLIIFALIAGVAGIFNSVGSRVKGKK